MENTKYTKRYYKIREVVELLGVPASTLRFWEKEFPELQPRRSSGNQRHYTPSDLEFLEILNFLLHIKGMKLDHAKDYLRHNRHNISKKIKIIDNLLKVRDDLKMLLDSLSLRGRNLGIEEKDIED